MADWYEEDHPRDENGRFAGATTTVTGKTLSGEGKTDPRLAAEISQVSGKAPENLGSHYAHIEQGIKLHAQYKAAGDETRAETEKYGVQRRQRALAVAGKPYKPSEFRPIVSSLKKKWGW